MIVHPEDLDRLLDHKTDAERFQRFHICKYKNLIQYGFTHADISIAKTHSSAEAIRTFTHAALHPYSLTHEEGRHQVRGGTFNRLHMPCNSSRCRSRLTSPTPLLQGAPVRLLHPVGRASPRLSSHTYKAVHTHTQPPHRPPTATLVPTRACVRRLMIQKALSRAGARHTQHTHRGSIISPFHVAWEVSTFTQSSKDTQAHKSAAQPIPHRHNIAKHLAQTSSFLK